MHCVVFGSVWNPLGKSVIGLNITCFDVHVMLVWSQPIKEKKNPYKQKEDFYGDRDYAQYVKTTIKPGMRVRARISYESVSQGDYGIYQNTNDGTPPAQFLWEGLGDTYWVFWHQVEILPPTDDADQEKKGEESEHHKIMG